MYIYHPDPCTEHKCIHVLLYICHAFPMLSICVHVFPMLSIIICVHVFPMLSICVHVLLYICHVFPMLSICVHVFPMLSICVHGALCVYYHKYELRLPNASCNGLLYTCMCVYCTMYCLKHAPFRIASLCVHSVFTQCSLGVHSVFTRCSLGVHSVFTQCSLCDCVVFY